MEIHNPHDKFFKDMFSRTEVAQDFCRRYLPPEIVNILDLSSLTPAKDTFVDQELREYFSDLLFSVKLTTGREIYIYLLFEHKSYQYPQIAFQRLCYMIKIWENDRKQGNSNFLRPIIPLVFYHGAEQWNIPLDFQSLFPWTQGLVKYLPQFEYLLFDLPRMEDEQIHGNFLLKASLIL
ncbi:MAG: Rpn family recombination-promoting nuclease/putative transposase [bacterium]|jgi:predicted transposase/invertase (TIGR01784 family)